MCVPRHPTNILLKLRFLRRVWAGGSLLSADLGKMVVRQLTIRQTLRKEPPC